MHIHNPTWSSSNILTEAPLFRQAQTGCCHSLNALMTRHDGLVHAVVRRQVLGDLPYPEALHAGRIGLWRAIWGFDFSRGVAFSTYAWPAIMRHVWRAVKAHAQSLPVTDNEPPPLQASDPALLWEATVIQQALHDLVQRLPHRLRFIIQARYGLEGLSPLTYRQIGAALGLTGERARQLHTEALVWLRHPAHSYTLRTLLECHTLADYQAAEDLAYAWLRRRAGRHDH